MSAQQTFGTDLSSRIGLGIIFGFVAALGIGAAYDGAYIVGPAVAFVGMGAWLYYASLRVTVTSAQVIVRRYGIVIFSAPRDGVRASVGRGGELKTHTALLLEAPGQKRIELLRTLFGRATLAELARLLNVREKVSEGFI